MLPSSHSSVAHLALFNLETPVLIPEHADTNSMLTNALREYIVRILPGTHLAS